MTSLLVLAAIMLIVWLWAIWRSETSAAFMSDWNYVPIIICVICLVMALGLKIR